MESLKTRFGYASGDVNWSGVLNTALDLRAGVLDGHDGNADDAAHSPPTWPRHRAICAIRSASDGHRVDQRQPHRAAYRAAGLPAQRMLERVDFDEAL